MDLVTCELCKKQFKKITNSHLREKHNTTLEKYINNFPFSIMTSDSVKSQISKSTKGKSYIERYGEQKTKTLIEKRKSQAIKQFQDIDQRIIRKKKNWKGYKDISGDLWRCIQYGAKIRNLDFDVTIEYIWEIFELQKGICPLSGRNIFIDPTLGSLNKNGYQRNTASLDRIDSSKGYIKGNVQWVHKDVNKLKSNWDQNYFIDLCNEITNYQLYLKNLKH